MKIVDGNDSYIRLLDGSGYREVHRDCLLKIKSVCEMLSQLDSC